MDIKSLKTDDIVTKTILDNTTAFKNIHPNIVTIFGGILIIPIISAIKQKNFKMLVILLVFRWLADCLDGGIARKYNKGSKLGETLDTIADTIFALVLGYYFTKIYNININYYYGIVLLWFWIMIYRYDLFNPDIEDTHKKLKVYKGSNLFDNFMRISTNNTWIMIALFAVLIYIQKDVYNV